MVTLSNRTNWDVSLIKKFWQTATVRTIDNDEQEITVTVDGKEFTITKASVRRHLQLADVDEIQAEEGEGSGHPFEPQPPPSPAQPTNEEPIPNVGVGASQEVECLEADLKQTKQLYGAAYTKLIMNVKKLKKTVKTSHSRRRAKIVVLDDEEASKYSSKQGRMIEEIDQDARVTLITPTQGEDQPEDQLGVLSAAKILTDAAKTNVHTYTRRRRADSTGSGRISTASRLFSTAEESVSTAGIVQEININTPSPVAIKDKGKGKMEEFEDEHIKRTKLQQEQDRLRHEAAVRLQEELDEKERQRMAIVHEAAQFFTEEEWENIRARVEADKELSRRLQAEERNKKYWKIIRVGNHTEVYQVFEDMLKTFDMDDLVKLWSLVQERFNLIEPIKDKEIEIWVELKRLFELDADDELWKFQKHIHDITWRLYDTSGVHHMLDAKLLVEQDNEMSRELLRKIFMQVERLRR
ncbi:hypothetical protein Tco_0424611 [Tanacetum coccineum]